MTHPDPGLLRPSFGIIGVPDNRAHLRTGGPELNDDSLVGALEANSARLAWSRASICPCAGFNTQTKQPDPTCSRCQGGGVFYFGPRNYVVPAEAGELTPLQLAILARDGAAVIHGVISKASQTQNFYDVLGNWVRGSMIVTVRQENKLGYYDRLVNLDSEVVYSQIVTVTAPATADIALRYLAVSVNNIQADDDSGAARYEQGDDFTTVNGLIRWAPGRAPVAGTRLSVHYVIHPTWLVDDHPYVIRETQRRRDGRLPRLTPSGNPTALPLQAAVRLEFLPPQQVPDAPPL